MNQSEKSRRIQGSVNLFEQRGCDFPIYADITPEEVLRLKGRLFDALEQCRRQKTTILRTQAQIVYTGLTEARSQV